jgi:hypothetical protein
VTIKAVAASRDERDERRLDRICSVLRGIAAQGHPEAKDALYAVVRKCLRANDLVSGWTEVLALDGPQAFVEVGEDAFHDPRLLNSLVKRGDDASLSEMRALTQDLTVSMWTLSAIGVLFESGLAENLREPRPLDELAARCPGLAKTHIERCLRVAAAAGVVAFEDDRYRLADGATAFSQEPLRATLRGDIRAQPMQALAFLDSSTGQAPVTGWRHTDRSLLQARGDASAAFPPMLEVNIVAGLGDLAARLDRPGARVLDVGVGVGSLAIAMCRTWPELYAVGVDVFDAPLGIARENVARAALEERIELRKAAVEDLRDEASFDVAWLPAFFLGAAVKGAAARVQASLRPGGCTQALLQETGFGSIQAMAGPPRAPAP